jgi:hypothetical protein
MNKAQMVSEIANLVGIPDPGAGVGSSVHKALFDGVCARFGIASTGTMPDQAQAIVEAAGLSYDPDEFDSRNTPSGGGSTVTRAGLAKIHEAVVVLLA